MGKPALTTYDLFFGCLGSGTTVANRNELIDNDYKIIAHIYDDGRVSYAIKCLPCSVTDEIEAFAKREAQLYQEKLIKREEDIILHNKWLSKFFLKS